MKTFDRSPVNFSKNCAQIFSVLSFITTEHRCQQTLHTKTVSSLSLDVKLSEIELKALLNLRLYLKNFLLFKPGKRLKTSKVKKMRLIQLRRAIVE